MAVRKRIDDNGLKSVETSGRGISNQEGDDSPTAGIGAAGEGERVDQIRDILFGAQRQEYERRFSRLEELLVKNISDLSNEITGKFTKYREEYDSRLTRLEELLVKNLSEVNLETERKINAHKVDNDKSFKQLDEKSTKGVSELREETGKQLSLQKSKCEQNINSLEIKLIDTISDLKKQLDADVISFKRDIDKTKSEILISLENLNINKADRSVLAGLLHHFASSLENKDNKIDSVKKQ